MLHPPFPPSARPETTKMGRRQLTMKTLEFRLLYDLRNLSSSPLVSDQAHFGLPTNKPAHFSCAREVSEMGREKRGQQPKQLLFFGSLSSTVVTTAGCHPSDWHGSPHLSLIWRFLTVGEAQSEALQQQPEPFGQHRLTPATCPKEASSP